MKTTSIAISLLGPLGIAACSSSPTASVSPDSAGAWQSEFAVPKSELSSHGTNPFFVLEPGFQCTLASRDGRKQLVITVLDQTEQVDGVETRVVEERETHADKPVEVSRNYFAISTRTNDVFYFGEDVDIYENGALESHEGSWRAGVGGAHFGLMMPGTIEIGRRYQQEIAPKVAMDRFEIRSASASLDTPAGRFEHCLEIDESNALEPGDHETKLYARGIGLIQDEDLRLVAHGPRSDRR